MLKKHVSFLILSTAAALYSNHYSSCLFKARLLNSQSPQIGQLTHAWPSTTNNN